MSGAPRVGAGASVEPDTPGVAGIRGESRSVPRSSGGRRFFRRLLIWIPTLAILYVAAGYLLVPALGQAQLERWLSARLDRPVKIARLRFDPFRLQADIERLVVGRRDGVGGALLSIADMHADLAWSSLRRRAPILERLRINKPVLEIEREADGLLSVDDLLKQWRTSIGPTAMMPRFSVANIELTDGRIVIDDARVGQKHRVEQLALTVPFLSSLPVHERIEVEPALSAVVNGARFTASGQAQPFGPERRSSLSIDLGTSDLIRYLDYLPWHLPGRVESARLAARVTLDFAQPAKQEPSLKISAGLTLADVELRDSQANTLLRLPAGSVEVRDYDPQQNRLDIGQMILSSPELSLSQGFDLNAWLDRRSARAGVAQATTPGAGETELGWSIEQIDLRDGRLQVGADGARQADLAFRASQVQARIKGLEADGLRPASISLELQAGEGETLALHGQFAHGPLVATGRVDLIGARLERWAPAVFSHWPMRVASGRLDVAGAFEYTHAAQGPAPLRVIAWKSRLRDLRLEANTDKTDGPVLAAQSLNLLELDGLSLDLAARRLGFARLKADGVLLNAARQPDGAVDLLALLVAERAAAVPASAGAQAVVASGDSSTNAAAPVSPVATNRAQAWHIDPGRVELSDLTLNFVDQIGKRTSTHRVVARMLTLGTVEAAERTAALEFDGVYGEGVPIRGKGSLGSDPFRLSLDLETGALPIEPWAAYAALPEPLRLGGGLMTLKGRLALSVPQAGGETEFDWLGDLALRQFSLRFGDAADATISISSLRAPSLAARSHPAQLRLAALEITGLQAALAIAENGELNLAALLPGAQQAPTAAAVAQPQAGPVKDQAPVRIDQIRFQGASLAVRDAQLIPTHVARLHELSGTIGPVGSAEPSQFELAGLLDAETRIRLSGHLRLSEPLALLSLQAQADALSLPSLSAYLAPHLGHQLAAGSADATINAQIQDRKLSARYQILLRDPALGDAHAGEHASTVPIEFAMALMRDPQGRIELNLPVAAMLDDPGFSYAAGVGSAFAAVASQAVADPFAWIAPLAGGTTPLPSRLGFEPGTSELDAGSAKQLGRLATALQARPGLVLSIQGFADGGADRAALAQRQFERMLKARKLRGQRGSDKTSLDQVSIGRGEYPVLVEALFREAQLPLPTSSNGRPRAMRVSEKAGALIATLPVGDSQLRDLAADRAQQVVRWLGKSGRLAAARLSEVRPELLSPKPNTAAQPPATWVDFGLAPRP